MSRKLLAGAVGVLAVAILAAAMVAQSARISSPDGIASTEIRGKYAAPVPDAPYAGRQMDRGHLRPPNQARAGSVGRGLDVRPDAELPVRPSGAPAPTFQRASRPSCRSS